MTAAPMSAEERIAALEAERDALRRENEALKCEGVITPVMAPAIQVDKTRCGFCVMETRGLIEGAFFAICPDCVENCAAAIRALAQKGE